MFKYFVYFWSKFFKILRGTSALKSSFDYDSKIESGTIFFNSSIGRHSYTGHDCSIINCNIGSFCSIANHVSIGGASHPLHYVSTSPVFLSHKDSVKTKFARHEYLPEAKTHIGHDVWIGEGVFIKAGVTVGNGAVIGMGSVVTKDVPDYAVVAGNPAKVIRYRFDQELIKDLLESQWWFIPAERLKTLGDFINDPRVFLDKLRGN